MFLKTAESLKNSGPSGGESLPRPCGIRRPKKAESFGNDPPTRYTYRPAKNRRRGGSMESKESTALKRTPLYPIYSNLPGVKLVDFGGWEMPLQFSEGILAEHKAVREGVGLFDVSHMGEISVTGTRGGILLG